MFHEHTLSYYIERKFETSRTIFKPNFSRAHINHRSVKSNQYLSSVSWRSVKYTRAYNTNMSACDLKQAQPASIYVPNPQISCKSCSSSSIIFNTHPYTKELASRRNFAHFVRDVQI